TGERPCHRRGARGRLPPRERRRRPTMSSYVDALMDDVVRKNPGEPEFHQAVREVAESVDLVLQRHPEYADTKVFERMIDPERVIMFRVPWVDDHGEIQINR